jgi:hypothetical protein
MGLHRVLYGLSSYTEYSTQHNEPTAARLLSRYVDTERDAQDGWRHEQWRELFADIVPTIQTSVHILHEDSHSAISSLAWTR